MLAFSFIAVTLSACTSFDNFKHTFFDEKSKKSNTDVIYIGVFEPRTGEQAAFGNEELRGIQLANSIYNNVKGSRVELIIVDNQSNPESAKAAIADLAEMKPVLIIGSYGESNSMIASDYVKTAKIPAITPSANNPLITEGNPYYFRACITDTQRGAGLAMYAYTALKARNIVMVTIKNDSTISTLAEGFSDKLEELEGKEDTISERISVDVDDVELKHAVTSIKYSDADAVFMPVGLEKADVIFSALEKEGAEGITFLGDPSWAQDEFVRMMKKHPSVNVVFPSDQMLAEGKTTTEAVTAETQRFLIEHQNSFGADVLPTENTSLGYDSYLIAMNAINRAADTSPDEIVKALNELDELRCTTGVFTFDKNGNPIRSVNLAKIENGLVVNAYSSDEVAEAGDMKKIER